MKSTIYLILFVLGMILTSATTATIMTVKPALPKHVDSGWFRSERSVDEFIKAKVNQGNNDGIININELTQKLNQLVSEIESLKTQ